MDFRKAFFPTEEETKQQARFIQQVELETRIFWMKKGLSDHQYSALKAKEFDEINALHPYQEYASRKSLLESGIISLESILKEFPERG